MLACLISGIPIKLNVLAGMSFCLMSVTVPAIVLEKKDVR